MNPLMLLKAAPWIIAGILALGVALMAHLYLKERDAFTAFRAEVKTLGEAAEAEKVRIQAAYDENLKKVKEQNENQLPRVRRDAVAAYKLRYPTSSCGSVSDPASSQQVDDGTVAKCVPDAAFIEAAAEDALKLDAWQSWAILNQIPVKE